MPTVSVIIPTLNRWDMLIDAVASIRMQTHGIHEILVVDDHSSDPRYVQLTLAGARMIRREQTSAVEFGHPALGVVRNAGVREATGEYLAFCDDDDVWLPSKLE